MSTQLLQALTMVLPIGVSGVVLIACMKFTWLEPINRPLDFGAMLGGRRLLGDSKTFRGLAVHVVVATVVVFALHAAGPAWWLAPQFASDPLALGLTVSLFYVSGEVVNSFAKRRLGIAAGESARGTARIQRFVDNVDGSLAVGFPLFFWYHVPWELLVTTGLLGYGFHEATDALMRRLRLKREK